MNIRMILFGFFPIDVRPRKEALSLVKAGCKLSIVCCNEKGAVKDFNRITIDHLGKISDWEGRMTATQLVKFWKKSFFFLLHNNNFHVLHCHDLTGLPPAVLIKCIFPRTKIVYDAHENYPDAIEEKYGHLAMIPFLLLEKFCLKFVNRIIGICQPQGTILMKQRYHINNFLCLPNFPSKNEFFVTQREKNNKKTVIIYSGAFLVNRGYEELILATEILRKTRDDFVISLLGGGHHKTTIEKMVKDHHLEDVIRFEGAVNFLKVKDYLNSADIGVVLYKPEMNGEYGLSNKIFEYISCGLPLIHPYYKASSYYLKSVGALSVNPSDPQNIAKKIAFLIDHPEIRQSIREKELALAPEYSWEANEKNLVNLYKSLFN